MVDDGQKGTKGKKRNRLKESRVGISIGIGGGERRREMGWMGSEKGT